MCFSNCSHERNDGECKLSGTDRPCEAYSDVFTKLTQDEIAADYYPEEKE